MYEFTVTYTETTVRASARIVYGRIIRRAVDWKLVVALFMTIGSLVAVHFYRGAFWLDGAVAVLLVFIVGIPVTLYRTRLKLSLDRLHRMKNPVGKFVATEEALTGSTDLGSSTVPWARPYRTFRIPGLLAAGNIAGYNADPPDQRRRTGNTCLYPPESAGQAGV